MEGRTGNMALFFAQQPLLYLNQDASQAYIFKLTDSMFIVGDEGDTFCQNSGYNLTMINKIECVRQDNIFPL